MMRLNAVSKKVISIVLGSVLLSGSIVSFGSSASAAATADINWYVNEQDIDGFGASDAFIETLGASGFQNYAEPARTQILDLLFNQTNGIGLSWIRNRIPIIEPSPGVWDWTKDPGQLFVMNEAKNRGVTRFFSTTWSPPGWMKTNGVANNGNGHLLTTQYQNYADYLSTYIREYKTRFNIDISAISIQNEPDNAPDYEGTLYTADELNNFIKNNLAPTFTRDAITAKVVAPETSWWSRTEGLINTSLNDPASNARIDIVAAHPYDGDYSILQTAKSKGKKVWATEVSTFEGMNDPSITDGLKWAKLIHNHMTVAESNAFFYWWLVSDSPAGGQGLINISTDNTTYSTNKRLFTFGNFSRFIRPGYKRIDATAQPVTGVYVSAYKDPVTNKLVVVAINDTTSSQSVNFKLNNVTGTTFTPYTTSASQNLAQGAVMNVTGDVLASALPAQSVTTFVGNVTPAAGLVMSDTLSNWDKIYSHTANLQITNIGTTETEGDTGVLQRTTNSTENIIYNVNNSVSLNLKAYFNDITSNSNNIKIYASSTNGNYVLQTASQDTPFATTGGWYRVNYTVGNLPANTHFIKIEIPANSKGYFTPVLSQVSITPGTTTTTTLTDPLSNWNSTFSHTANLQLTDIGSTVAEGDTSVAQRTTNTTENLIYNVAGSKSASVKIYFNDNTSDSNNIKIYASSTNGNYVLQTASQDTPFATTGSWYRVNYTVSNLPANTNFIKIEIPANSKGYFTPVISQVSITHDTTATTTLTDPLSNWNSAFSHTANLQLADIGSTATEGDTSVAQRTTNTTESMIYNAANSKTASVKIYFNDNTSDSNNIKIYASSTNGNYVLQTASQDTPFATAGSWYRVNYTVGNLPANTNFIKIEIPANTKGNFTPVISQVTITY
ncbi:glycoside hydrolase [Cohnella yongneupensis]|uniref:Glycoside hydrolase n=1 Tax=Cohnella yongneupensis TaxID=425006 RepID=A0ABW0R537_9BACL